MRTILSKLFILFSLITVSACGTSNMNATSSDQLTGQISSLTYQVSGGGDIQFTITSSGYGAYMVNVTRYQFQQRNQTIALQQYSPSYAFVTAIFQRQVQITSFNTGNSMGGSWSQITLNSGSNSISIQTPSINGSTSEFDMLYQSIASQL